MYLYITVALIWVSLKAVQHAIAMLAGLYFLHLFLARNLQAFLADCCETLVRDRK